MFIRFIKNPFIDILFIEGKKLLEEFPTGNIPKSKSFEYITKTFCEKKLTFEHYRNIDNSLFMANKSKGIDEYYTSKKTVDVCISKLEEYYQLNYFDTIIEPSAGDGSFIDKIEESINEFEESVSRIYLDINPRHDLIDQQNYMNFKFETEKNKHTLVIGNPPFGTNGKLAKQFIDKSSDFADIIAFILPISYSKNSKQKTIPKNYHLLDELMLQNEVFMKSGQQTHTVNCVFQIWEKRKKERPKENKTKPKYNYSITNLKAGLTFNNICDSYDLKKNNKNYIFVRRAGSGAGTHKKKKEIFNKDGSSKDGFTLIYGNDIRKYRKLLIDKVDAYDWTDVTSKCTGQKSINQQEFLDALNEILDEC